MSFWHYLAFPVVTLVGFVVGWRPRFAKVTSVDRQYIEGLNQLLKEQPDAALDNFVAALEVNVETLETHLAMGALWRRRGEVERAIRIHQNVLTSSSLSTDQLEEARLQLGLDYAHSGLLDRAEVLFRSLANSTNVSLSAKALKNLLAIFEQEQEWKSAIDTANSLAIKQGKAETSQWRYRQAHYCCELAEPLAASGELVQARHWLELGGAYFSRHPRVVILSAKLELTSGSAANAISLLLQLDVRDSYLMEVIPLMLEAYREVKDPDSAESYLVELYQTTHLFGLIPEITLLFSVSKGNAFAMEFLVAELRKHPPQSYISGLIEAVGVQNVEFSSIKSILDQLLCFSFRCSHCGFEGTHLHWSCPSCKFWI